MAERSRLPRLSQGQVAAIWWDDPCLDTDIYDPAEPETLETCLKVTVGVVTKLTRAKVWLAHEVFLDQSGQQWVRTVIPRRLIVRIETVPGCVIQLDN